MKVVKASARICHHSPSGSDQEDTLLGAMPFEPSKSNINAPSWCDQKTSSGRVSPLGISAPAWRHSPGSAKIVLWCNSHPGQRIWILTGGAFCCKIKNVWILRCWIRREGTTKDARYGEMSA